MASMQTMAEPASTITRILMQAQVSSISLHRRLIEELVNCRRQYPSFFEHWTDLLAPLFLVAVQRPAVEQAIGFCAQFVVYRDSNKKECDDFAEGCLRLLLEWSGGVHRIVRYRATQMIYEVMQRTPEDGLLDDDLVDTVVDHMLLRMQDTVAAIRVLAVRSLWRLAIATDPEELERTGIIKQFRQDLELDDSPDVRRSIVNCMPPLSSTVADVTARTADIHESVRRAAFMKLGNDFPINSLSISQRAAVMERGLSDRVPAVKAECFRMLKYSWLRRDCGGDVLSLLKLIDVETHAIVAETIMAELMHAGVVQVTSTLRAFLHAGESGTAQLLEAEEALYWRTICQFFHDEEQARSSDAAASRGEKAVVDAENAAAKQDALDRILPSSVADYVKLVEQHMNAGHQYQFSCQQLLKLGKLLDFTDSSSRKVAGVFLHSLLQGSDFADHGEHVGDGVSIAGDKDWEEAIVDFGRSVHSAPGEWINVLVGIVEDLGRPCREGGANALQWLKCLAMVGILLQDMNSTSDLIGSPIEPSELVDALLISAAKHIHTEVQRAGLRCLGLFCHLEDTPSPKIVGAMQLALYSPHQPVRNMAVMAIFDLINCHGVKCIHESGISGLPASVAGTELRGSQIGKPVMDMLASWLDVDAAKEETEDKIAQMDFESTMTIVAEGFAKLLIRSKTREIGAMQDAVLRKLLLHYFNNKTVDFPRMNQCLAIFFEYYTAVSAEHKHSVSRVFIPVVRCTWVAEGNSTLARQQSRLVSQFMLQLMIRPVKKRVKKDAGSFPEVHGEVDNGAEAEGHEDLAIRIGAEVKVALQQPKFPSPKMYAGILYRVASCLQLRETQQDKIKFMHSLVGSTIDNLLLEKIVPKTLIQQMRVLRQRLQGLDHNPDEGLTDEQISLLTESMLPNLALAEDEDAIQVPASEPGSARRKTSTRRKKKRASSPVYSDTSSPEVYTPVPRDRGRTRSGRVLEL